MTLIFQFQILTRFLVLLKNNFLIHISNFVHEIQYIQNKKPDFISFKGLRLDAFSP